MGLKRVKFRNGRQWIPEHLAAMMTGLKTHTMTREQATEAASQRLVKNHIERAFDDIVSTHIREHGGG